MVHVRLVAPKMRVTHFIIPSLLCLLSAKSFGQDEGSSAENSVSIGTARYDDNNVTVQSTSAATNNLTRFFSDQGHETYFSLSGSYKDIRFKQEADLLEKQLKGKTVIGERSIGVNVNQGLAIGSTVGMLAGSTKSALSDSKYGGFRIGQWWREDTLQTVLEFRRTILKQATLDFVDTDGKRVITPADLDGSNATLTMTHMTTPSTILRGAYSTTTRTDRPPAWSASGEVRQFIDSTNSAIHAALTHYENIGEIKPKTTYGSVVSDTARIEWNQKAWERSIFNLGYRYYLETEDPRAADAKDRRVGTDSIFGSWRWRLSDVAWTAASSELSLFFNSYRANSGVTGTLFGSAFTYAY